MKNKYRLLLPLIAIPAMAAGVNTGAIDNWLKGQLWSNTPLYQSYQISPADSRVPSDVQNFLARQFVSPYDNALVGLYSLFSNTPAGTGRARDILSEYSNNFIDGSGVPFKSNLEFVVTTGEAMYIGILGAQYAHKTADYRFEASMKSIDAYALNPVNNIAGGIRAGNSQPQATQVSTENNIDTLAYLQMRYHLLLDRKGTGDLDQAVKVRARELEIAKFLTSKLYDPVAGKMLRGYNDSAYVTDAQFATVNFIAGLKKTDPDFATSSGLSGIDLSKVMRYAESHARSDGFFGTPQGFRFADQTNSPVSYERTAMAARAYDALGESANAAAMRDIVSKAQMSAGGALSWPYAATPGLTSSDGYFSTAYPSVSATMWSAIALNGYPDNWPYTFAEKVPTLVPPTSSTLPPGRTHPNPLPKLNPHPGPKPIRLKAVLGQKAPADSYRPATDFIPSERPESSHDVNTVQ